MHLKDKEVCVSRVQYITRHAMKIQAYLRNIVGSIPDHRNKVNIAKSKSQIFWFPIIYKSYLYPIL